MLSLCYNENNSFLFVNATEIYQLKPQDLEINPYLLFLRNVSKGFTIDNIV